MKDFGNSFSRGIRIRAAGFVLFCSRVFLRSSGGLGVQAASGTGWERAARSHGRVGNTTLRSFRSDPALEWSHFFSSSSSFSASFNGYRPLFATNSNSPQMKDFRKTFFRTLIPELKRCWYIHSRFTLLPRTLTRTPYSIHAHDLPSSHSRLPVHHVR